MFPGVLHLTAKTEVLVASTIDAKNMPGWERNAKKNPFKWFPYVADTLFPGRLVDVLAKLV